ncbi:MAG: UTP--glucose-1-phosphate uridylyltransferase [Verrucomicrobia bacterium]|jgi:UDP-N-acetylglucosamine pyrophosphorylase|nr:UTP--glucose-1-phosphate uridylyltransferase [Verrucomicrobiota bacterium]
MANNRFDEFETLLRNAQMGAALIRAFQHSYEALQSGQTGMLPEATIQPVTELPRLDSTGARRPASAGLLARVAILKLNGGLGTSMGLEGPKALLSVKNGLSFLDIIARQILQARQQSGIRLPFLLMNSFSTSTPTLEWLKRYPELGAPADVELMQNRIPKVDAQSLRPARWPANPTLEWCPPGHGDLYPSLVGSGWLDRLLDQGIRFLFVSNADNLGATLDPALLQHFATSDQSFLMEVCERSAADRKGGHLAQRHGQLLLRESAQCPDADQPSFQDIARHRFFNTNNLWLRLDRLQALLDRNDGLIPLPVIRNCKTVDPRDPTSPKVFQLETAMGAAIECFPDAAAIVVPRSRFAPVKTTSDLLAVRSDAYDLTDDYRVSLNTARHGIPPAVDLDPVHCKQVDQLDAGLAAGVPSLKDCSSLKTKGPVHFSDRNVFQGSVTITNTSPSPALVPAGTYQDTAVSLP